MSFHVNYRRLSRGDASRHQYSPLLKLRGLLKANSPSRFLINNTVVQKNLKKFWEGDNERPVKSRNWFTLMTVTAPPSPRCPLPRSLPFGRSVARRPVLYSQRSLSPLIASERNPNSRTRHRISIWTTRDPSISGSRSL